MMRYKSFLLTVGLSVMISHSTLLGQPPDAGHQMLEKDVERLADKIDQLTYQVGLLVERFKEMQRQLESGEAVEQQIRMPFVVRQSMKPPPSILKEVEEPTKWTTEEISSYIDRVLDVSDRSHHVFENDPQIVMLARLGETNLDLMVQALGTHTYAADHHLVEAIARLVRPEHRDYILEQLPLYQRLITVVVRQGWEEDARNILIEGLSSGSAYPPADWIKATARLDDLRVPDALMKIMLRGRQPVAIYHALEQFDGIDLDRIVSETWVAISSHTTARITFSTIAISHGLKDALVFVARMLIKEGLPEYQLRPLRSILKQSVDRRGTSQEIALWVLENSDRLLFDPVTKRFVEQ